MGRPHACHSACRFHLVSPVPHFHPECSAAWAACLALASAALLSLQDLGVTKVGHMKRILCGIKELSRSPPAAEA